MLNMIISAIFGLCMGSFVHVAISRFSPHYSFFQYVFHICLSRSKCPDCQMRLHGLLLIPIFSWLILKGRCKICKKSIPIHYLLMELTLGCQCIFITWLLDMTVWTGIIILLGHLFFILACIDIKYLLLPNYFNYAILLIGLLTAHLGIANIQLDEALIGIICGFALLWLPAKLHHCIKKYPGLGGGDIKLLSALGTWIHYEYLPLLLVIASTIGIIYLLFYGYIKQDRLTNVKIPFGPCLLIASYGILLFASVD